MTPKALWIFSGALERIGDAALEEERARSRGSPGTSFAELEEQGGVRWRRAALEASVEAALGRVEELVERAPRFHKEPPRGATAEIALGRRARRVLAGTDRILEVGA